MSWLCEVCGYENQFDDEVQLTECACCGEFASEKVLFQARRELEACRRAERAKAAAEEAQRRRELRRKRIDRAAKGALVLAKAVPVIVILSIVGALAWIIFSFVSSDLTVALWSQRMQVNLSALTFHETALSSLQNGVGRILGIPEDVAAGAPNDTEKYSDNLSMILEAAGARRENMVENILQLHEVADIRSRKIENQTVEMVQRNFDAVGYLASNFQAFWNNAAENIEALIEEIARRGG